jgi:hypothetical protein
VALLALPREPSRAGHASAVPPVFRRLVVPLGDVVNG